MKYLLMHLGAVINSDQVNLPKDQLNAEGSLNNAFIIFFGLAGGVAVITVIYGGIRYILSQGNPQETAKSKDIILNSLIGLAVIISAAAIVSLLTRYL